MKVLNYNPECPIFAQVEIGDLIYQFSICEDAHDAILVYEVVSKKDANTFILRADDDRSVYVNNLCDSCVLIGNCTGGYATSKGAAYEGVKKCLRYHLERDRKEIEELEKKLTEKKEACIHSEKLLEIYNELK